jgi:hypothetical protein
MFLMGRLVSRSSRSLAVMLGGATRGRGRARDDLRGRSPHAVRGPFLCQSLAVLNPLDRSTPWIAERS